MILCAVAPSGANSVQLSCHLKKKKNTENQPLSKTVNVFLGRLHDPKQTNKVKSHSGFSGDIGTLFKMS